MASFLDNQHIQGEVEAQTIRGTNGVYDGTARVYSSNTPLGQNFICKEKSING